MKAMAVFPGNSVALFQLGALVLLRGDGKAAVAE